MQSSVHLHFKGNCREAFEFYAKTMGGKIVFSMTFGESPAAAQTAADWREKIIHARLDMGDHFILGTDAAPQYYRAPQGIDVMLAVDKPAEAERIFNLLAEKGTITIPFQETFWAHRFGMCTDRFGIPWAVNCEKPVATR